MSTMTDPAVIPAEIETPPPAPEAEAGRRGRWIDHWEPEDETFWERTGRAVANRNLLSSVLPLRDSCVERATTYLTR